MSITDKFNDKKVLIWGYGMEGKSTEAFLKTHCKPKSIEIYEGKREDLDDSAFDYIFKSPGIPGLYPDEKYTSQTEIFLESYRDQIIGITGTKGKSTTSSMLYSVLDSCSQHKTLLVGNIGIPALDYYGQVDKDTIIVMEMSCHQLNNVKVSPKVSIFLNLYEEHLDYYKTMDAYFAAKANVTKFQQPGDYLYKGKNVPEIPTKASVIPIEEFVNSRFDLSILGLHNQWNANVVYDIATKIYGLDDEKVREAMKNFKGLPHRLEYVCNKDGVDYYDDSISTIPTACISAVHSIPNVKAVIVGGMDRGIDYATLVSFIKETKDVIFLCTYASGKRVMEEIGEELPNCIYVEDIDGALSYVKANIKKGSCVLSPAAASYGYFKNFNERGDYYRSKI